MYRVVSPQLRWTGDAKEDSERGRWVEGRERREKNVCNYINFEPDETYWIEHFVFLVRPRYVET